jgi:aryl-alcohol dehydrogenase-like predicted oxidoreductase
MSGLHERIRLGRTELHVGRLGLGASYGAPTAAFEAAFEAGCNYFYWGAIRGRRMARAIRNIASRGGRDGMVVVIQALRRSPRGLEKSLMRGLRTLGLDHADVLLLGWYNKPPKPRLLDGARALQSRGAFRYLGIAGHHRPLFPRLARVQDYDVFHIRYNAANRGAEQDVFPRLGRDRPGIVAFTATRQMTLVKSRRIPAGERRPTAGDCYRFVLSHPSVDVVITAPSRMAYMQKNLFEAAKGPMTEPELAWMRRIGDRVYGRRREEAFF